jgi:hypothetical protein
MKSGLFVAGFLFSSARGGFERRVLRDGAGQVSVADGVDFGWGWAYASRQLKKAKGVLWLNVITKSRAAAVEGRGHPSQPQSLAKPPSEDCASVLDATEAEEKRPVVEDWLPRGDSKFTHGG